MSNHYFQFKQFTVYQDKCSMKVSTDACIQGAWTPVKAHVNEVLDIGAGTGLLSLMLSQRNDDIQIDALEIDEDACVQARQNIQISPWADRVGVVHADATNHFFDKLYDMVICNPPFFNNSLLGNDAGRNNARHTISLAYRDLFRVLSNTLKPSGYASVLLPAAEHETWADILHENKWGIEHLLRVIPKAGQQYNRVVSICVPYECDTAIETLQIYNADNSYTAAFVDMMKQYYLNL